MLSSSLPTGESVSAVAFRRNLQDIMVGCGFQEIITYPLTSLEVLGKLSATSDAEVGEPLKMANAMSRELEYLRTSLRAGVLGTLARNQRNREDNIRLFEIAKVFIPRTGDLPEENEILCGLVDSVVSDVYWQHKSVPVDFYFVKGIVQTVLARLGVEAEYMPSSDATLNPARCAMVMAGSIKIGVIGEVHPAVLRQFDVSDTAFLFELDMDKLIKLSSRPLVYKAVSKYPGTTRDMAVLLDASVEYQKIIEIIRSFNLVSDLQLFDLYVGEQVPAGKKSVAFRLTYQAADRTLKDEEVDEVQQRILERLSKELGAILRK
jgi:phenylalanyl-tRNA synthetase beta chain